jgi:hypothetical protein
MRFSLFVYSTYMVVVCLLAVCVLDCVARSEDLTFCDLFFSVLCNYCT